MSEGGQGKRPKALRKEHLLKQIQALSLPLYRLKGIGPKRADLLAQKGIRSVLDLLFFTPFRYEDRRRIHPLKTAPRDLPVVVRGRVILNREERFFPSRKRLFRIRLAEGETTLDLLWFHYRKPHLMRLAPEGTDLIAYGRITEDRGLCRMIHPDVTPLEEQDAASISGLLGYVPVYSAVRGFSPNLLRSTIARALDLYRHRLRDPLPEEMLRDLNLPGLSDALEFVHRPRPECPFEDLNGFTTPYHRRLLFDRFFLVMAALLFLKKTADRRPAPRIRVSGEFIQDLERYFPFELTGDQRKAVWEIVRDLSGPKPMNRLILGDVGCGKTMVAAAAAWACIRNGKQAAMMVPTRILAKQHASTFSEFPNAMGFRPVLLTSGPGAVERRKTYRKIRSGSYNLVIGTQALLREQLEFSHLGLVIIDEQHRFGVEERAALHMKGENPHQLILSATPIPRTLAMTLYGDMDISMIHEYPKKRVPVLTQTVSEAGKREVFDTVKQAMSLGRQCFVICPVIEGTENSELKNAEDMAEKLKKLFTPPYRIGLIHGRMDPAEREKVMEDFAEGRIHLLVGTTVLEVGIHVPNAAVMVVEHPERFGLAQLHQLRGRVGRGTVQGTCILMVSGDLSEKALTRLRVLTENQDGFAIAEKDLGFRGQGELMGLRQSGMGELDIQEIMGEPDLLALAKKTAQQILRADPELSRPENAPLLTFVESFLS